MVTMTTDRLYFTDSEEADRLLVSSPMALLIGFALDQQVTVQKAFSGPLELQQRLGHLDAGTIAKMDPEKLAAVFAERPALHRFPGSMAKRVHALAQAVTKAYDGNAARVWTEAKDGKDLEKRIAALPGFGEMKVKSLIAVLGKQLGTAPKGWEDVAPDYPTLGDVDSLEKLAEYQGWKRSSKAAAKESGKAFEPWADKKQAEKYAAGKPADL
jgi:uncharacterized HhH-GPD family protein